jgi:Luciferase
MNHLREFQEQVSAWPGVSIRAHRFGGTEFCFGNAEVGHIHPDGIVDIPMPRPVHDALLEEGLAEPHRWVPDSGWITFRVGREKGPEARPLACAALLPAVRAKSE